MRRERIYSRSNIALKNPLSTVESEKHQSDDAHLYRMLDSELQGKQLFQESLNKIQKIKAMVTENSNGYLITDLNDIIDLIRGQRVKAKIALEDLHKMAQHNAENQRIFRECEVNTDEIVISKHQDNIDEQIQTQQPNCNGKKENKQERNNFCQNNDKKYETYYKLVCIIDKLNVDYRQILPTINNLPEKYLLPNIEQRKKQYRILKSQQIIKLQKVFINKLATMQTNAVHINQSHRRDDTNVSQTKSIIEKNCREIPNCENISPEIQKKAECVVKNQLSTNGIKLLKNLKTLK